MAQTILQIAQNVARSIGIDPPGSLVANTEDTPQRMLQAIREAGRALTRRDWVRLTYGYSFTTTSGITQYPLPTSPTFDHMVPDSAWDRTNIHKARGPGSSQAYQRAQADMLTGITFARPWTLRADGNRVTVFELEDDPGDDFTIAYDYVTAEWLFDGGSTYSDTITSDSQVTVYQDELIEAAVLWRVRRALGLEYADHRVEADRLEASMFAQERGAVVCLTDEPIGFGYNAPEYGHG